ncbi:MAG: YtxH domain-containing protein [Ruminococcus sp.]|nr:YtxH domain-containing protein [Ruminococcus sp.]
MEKKKTVVIFTGLILLGVAVLFLRLDIPVRAAGFIDNTLNDAHLYSRYDISNYQLDFYVDSSGGWLPWNWDETIGQSAMYAIYALTNVLWLLNCQLAQGAGYIVQEAFKLDFIGQMAGRVGKNIQTLAGVSPSGISTEGFYSGCLLLLIVIVGAYVLYVGAMKRETTKAVSAVTSFLVIFVVSAVLIGYAPEMITNLNEFSRDMTDTTMNLGLKMMGEDTGTDGTADGATGTIRDTLWRIQVDAPWELLQFGSVGEVDGTRVNSLKDVSPEEEDGKAREDAVKAEVTEQKNMNLSIPKVMERLGTVLFLFLMDLVISIFVFLFSGSMILSQILFIVFAIYLPISFLVSMIPTFSGMAKKAVLSLFNTIMLRVGITLIVVTTFSISYLVYTMVGDYPFFLIMFVQIVVFVGTFFALPNILGMILLPSGASGAQGLTRLMMTNMLRQGRGFSRFRKYTGGSKNESSRPDAPKQEPGAGNPAKGGTQGRDNLSDAPVNPGEATGRKLGALRDMPNKAKDKARDIVDSAKDMPTNAKYAVHQGKENLRQNVDGFKDGVTKYPRHLQDERERKREARKNVMDTKRDTLKGEPKESPSRATFDNNWKPKNTGVKEKAPARRNVSDVSNKQEKAGSSIRENVKDTPRQYESPFLLKSRSDTKESGYSAGGLRESATGNSRDRQNVNPEEKVYGAVPSGSSGREERPNQRIFKSRDDISPAREIRERHKTNQNDRGKKD